VSGWTLRDDGIVLAVRVTPRSSKEMLGRGREDGGFAARIAAAPVDGEANAALVRLVARTFGVAKRDVTIVGGDTSRAKRVAIAGDASALAGIARRLYEIAP